MKRPLLIALFVVLIATGDLIAQTSRFGPKAGVNLSTWYNSLLTNINWRFGFQVGVAWDTDFGNKLHFAPEILFIQKGFVQRTPQFDRKDHFRMNYLEIPLIAKFDLNDTKGNKPFFSLGAYFSYYLGGNLKQTQEGNDLGTTSIEGLDRKLDIGAIVGGGMDLGQFIFELRGEVGFMAPVNFDTGRHATISVHFSYLFNNEEDDEVEYEDEY